jgi:hypothetical protein
MNILQKRMNPTMPVQIGNNEMEFAKQLSNLGDFYKKLKETDQQINLVSEQLQNLQYERDMMEKTFRDHITNQLPMIEAGLNFMGKKIENTNSMPPTSKKVGRKRTRRNLLHEKGIQNAVWCSICGFETRDEKGRNHTKSQHRSHEQPFTDEELKKMGWIKITFGDEPLKLIRDYSLRYTNQSHIIRPIKEALLEGRYRKNYKLLTDVYNDLRIKLDRKTISPKHDVFFQDLYEKICPILPFNTPLRMYGSGGYNR